jgi:hypothetical protein
MRVLAIAACATLVFVEAPSAHPLDSPGTIYIDGVPCNLACRSYMDWSRQVLRANQGASGANARSSKTTEETPRKHVSKRAMRAAAPHPKKTNGLQATLTVTPQATLKVTPKAPPPPSATDIGPVGRETRDPPAAPPEPLLKAGKEANEADRETSKVSSDITPQQQITAALAVAEQITDAEGPKMGVNHDVDEAKSGSVVDAEASSPKPVGDLVALLITRPAVKSASALKGSTIAIDATPADVGEYIRSALMAAGAAEIQLSVSEVSPLDRLVSGDVQAAVLKLVSPDAAESFPDIKGFKVYRVPLSP